ncbi:MAG: hypothetical protein UHM85_09390 [Acutalibacteraceae bacterium]|nr:hypothetical protein [Acutalibacteraceae bacterium]
MNKSSKKYIFSMGMCLALMFVWIFVTVAATGGREIADFTKQDNICFGIFIVVEIITLLSAMFFGKKYYKAMENGRQISEQREKTKSEKIADKRGFILSLVALVVSFSGIIVGIIINNKTELLSLESAEIMFVVCLAVAVLMFVLNVLFTKVLVNRFNNKKVTDVQQFFLSHRDEAKKTAMNKLLLLNKIRSLTDCYAISLFILAFFISVSGGVIFESNVTLPCFLAAFIYLAVFCRIRFPIPKEVFDEDETYVDEKDFPYLYSLTREAAKELGCSDNIKLALLSDSNAGIAKVGNFYSVQLGAVLLNILTEQELYNVLIHEFAHMASESNSTEKAGEYYNWIVSGGNPHSVSNLTNKFFCLGDYLYAFEYNLYMYAASMMKEVEADKQMICLGNAEAAATSLLKLKYYSFYDWENGTRDYEPFYKEDHLSTGFINKDIELFKKAVTEHSELWNKFIDVEIISRKASHPTLKMRLEYFGFSEVSLLKPDFPEPIEEAEKALNYVEELICKNNKEDYGEIRKVYYLEPKEKVEQWEKAGKPIVAEEYSDIISALRRLGRTEEAKALCDRAINELPLAAALYAYFTKGMFLLHSYDESGIDFIYKAIENNKNFIEEGLEVIGQYCCLTGKQEQLDVYRAKAVEIAQEQKDVYSKLDNLQKGDSLSEENLPDNMLEEILAFIKSNDKESVDKVYLVRKTITEDFFTSAFVIKFKKDAADETKEDVMYKIFKYLDTCSDWQFSLFDYSDVEKVKVEQIKNSCVYNCDK